MDDVENNRKLVLGIVNSESMLHIGNVSLQRLDWINRSAELAIVIGETDAWGKGYGVKACKAMLYHGFMKLGFHRIWSGTSETNLGMLHVFDRIGMAKEGAFKEGMFLNGAFRDVLSYGMTTSMFLNVLGKYGPIVKDLG